MKTALDEHLPIFARWNLHIPNQQHFPSLWGAQNALLDNLPIPFQIHCRTTNAASTRLLDLLHDKSCTCRTSSSFLEHLWDKNCTCEPLLAFPSLCIKKNLHFPNIQHHALSEHLLVFLPHCEMRTALAKPLTAFFRFCVTKSALEEPLQHNTAWAFLGQKLHLLNL